VAARRPRAHQQDFTVNVGDRIFFDTDSSVDPRRCAADLSRQAQWLNQYRQYAIVVEGHADERGTREYNLALGARRAAATRDYPGGTRRRRQPHEDDLLRQGTPGRRLRRHFLLVAEPPRGHHAVRRRQLRRKRHVLPKKAAHGPPFLLQGRMKQNLAEVVVLL
jgi:hypothetical protein